MRFDRKYLIWSLFYAVAGMGLGIYMAASHNHGQHVTHAHILLVGFVVSLAYGIIHKLWLGDTIPGKLGKIQFVIHHAGALLLFGGLLMLYGGMYPEDQLEPFLATASITVMIGMILMLILVLKTNTARS